jgi:hypothetical protein
VIAQASNVRTYQPQDWAAKKEAEKMTMPKPEISTLGGERFSLPPLAREGKDSRWGGKGSE